MTLTEFLLARVAEDETMARTATAGPWRHNSRKEWFTDPDKLRAARAGIRQSGGEEYVSANDGKVGVAATGPADDSQAMADARHIAHYDPDRVLGECEAKRRIVEAANEERPKGANWTAYMRGIWAAQNAVLYDLALPYADHPDYREEWSV